jgi:hypothetical protein
MEKEEKGNRRATPPRTAVGKERAMKFDNAL